MEPQQTQPLPTVQPIAQPSTTDLIKHATEAATALKMENDRKAQLLREEQDLYSRKLLGGDSTAGSRPLEPSEADKKKAEAIKYFEGTDLAKIIAKHG